MDVSMKCLFCQEVEIFQGEFLSLQIIKYAAYNKNIEIET